MEGRPGTAAEPGSVDDGNGYPLRDEATEPFPPPPPPVAPPAEPVEDEIYAAPAEPGPPAGRRRFAPVSPWPVVLAVLLLLTGLGVAYAVSRPSHNTPASGTAPAGAAPAPAPAPSSPQPSAPSTPTTSSAAQPVPAAPAKPTTVAVPSLVGSSLPRAIAALRQAKLTAVVVRVPSDTPEGRVVAQRPSAGMKAPEGGRVRLSVSVQQLVAVPNVTGVQGLAAVHTLQGDHLVASLRYVPSTQPARRVVSQSPGAGTKVRRGTTIRLNLSQGLRASVTVPNVVGEDEASARSDLTAAGFKIRSVDSTTSDSGEDGVVLDESPSGGSSAPRGATVTLSVGRYSGD